MEIQKPAPGNWPRAFSIGLFESDGGSHVTAPHPPTHCPSVASGLPSEPFKSWVEITGKDHVGSWENGSPLSLAGTRERAGSRRGPKSTSARGLRFTEIGFAPEMIARCDHRRNFDSDRERMI